jgi:hypothetical protein
MPVAEEISLGLNTVRIVGKVEGTESHDAQAS